MQANVTQSSQMTDGCERSVLQVWDLCAGMGSFSQGLTAAGQMEVTLAVDSDYHANVTHKEWIKVERRAKGLPKIDVDSVVRTMTIQKLVTLLGENLSSLPEGCDVIIAGTPCQGYSNANSTRGTATRPAKHFDPRHDMVHVLLWIIAKKRPKYVIWENVIGCTEPVMQPNRKLHCGFWEIQYGLAVLGYQRRTCVENAEFYGVPQTRARVIVCAAKANLHLPERPIATHRGKDLTVAKTPAYYNEKLKDCYRAVDGPITDCYRAVDRTAITDHALLRAVTVKDATADLPHDDTWKSAGAANRVGEKIYNR
eukprot:gene27346-33687_t